MLSFFEGFKDKPVETYGLFVLFCLFVCLFSLEKRETEENRFNTLL